MDNFVLIKNGYFYELILKWFLFFIINVNFKIKNLDSFREVIIYCKSFKYNLFSLLKSTSI